MGTDVYDLRNRQAGVERVLRDDGPKAFNPKGAQV